MVKLGVFLLRVCVCVWRLLGKDVIPRGLLALKVRKLKGDAILNTFWS